MTARYGRNKRRRDRERIAGLERDLTGFITVLKSVANDRDKARGEAHYYKSLLDELEARLRKALGSRTALTVRAAKEEVEGLSAKRYGRLRVPLHTLGPLRFNVDPLAQTPSQYEELYALVMEVTEDPVRSVHFIRFWEHDKRLGEQAYMVSDMSLAELGPSSTDRGQFALQVVNDLFRAQKPHLRRVG